MALWTLSHFARTENLNFFFLLLFVMLHVEGSWLNYKRTNESHILSIHSVSVILSMLPLVTCLSLFCTLTPVLYCLSYIPIHVPLISPCLPIFAPNVFVHFYNGGFWFPSKIRYVIYITWREIHIFFYIINCRQSYIKRELIDTDYS